MSPYALSILGILTISTTPVKSSPLYEWTFCGSIYEELGYLYEMWSLTSRDIGLDKTVTLSAFSLSNAFLNTLAKLLLAGLLSVPIILIMSNCSFYASSIFPHSLLCILYSLPTGNLCWYVLRYTWQVHLSLLWSYIKVLKDNSTTQEIHPSEAKEELLFQ